VNGCGRKSDGSDGSRPVRLGYREFKWARDVGVRSRCDGKGMLDPPPSWTRRVWVGWLRFEFRAMAVLLPVIILEMAVASAVAAHLPFYLGFVGAAPLALARDAWRLAAQIGFTS
jgi:hypothetical protein